jgi:hypothetical protein
MCSGSARLWRAGFDVAPKRTFLFSSQRKDQAVSTEVRDREDALATSPRRPLPRTRSAILLKFTAASR